MFCVSAEKQWLIHCVNQFVLSDEEVWHFNIVGPTLDLECCLNYSVLEGLSTPNNAFASCTLQPALKQY